MKSKTKLKRAIGYVRISRVNGRGEEGGPALISDVIQRETIGKIAAAKGYEIVAWYEDRDETGKRLNRPAFEEAMQSIERGEAEAMIVYRWSRFARSVLNGERAVERIEAANASLIAGDIDVDTKTPTGKILRGFMSLMAEFELDLIEENWTAARTNAINGGKFIGPNRPIGYVVGEDGKLDVHPVEGPAVREVLFRGRASGKTFAQLAEDFHARTGRRIHHGSIKLVLANRIYLGEVRHGETLVNLNAHDALVSESEFELVQRTPRASQGRGKGRSSALLTGILVCGSCGRRMTYCGDRTGNYTCPRFGGGRERCTTSVQIHKDRVDPFVSDTFLARYGDVAAKGTSGVTEDLEDAEAALEDAIRERADFLALGLGDVVDADAYRDAVQLRQDAVDVAVERVSELRESLKLDETMIAIDEDWTEIPVESRRALLSDAIERVTIHRVGRGTKVPIEDRATIVFVEDEGPESSADEVPVAA
jgi:DNA invertase Pin-like site-specific DNA recombinase